MTTKQQAEQAILAHDPKAWGICNTGGNYFMANVGRCTAYYVIIDGQIVGDVWYE